MAQEEYPAWEEYSGGSAGYHSGRPADYETEGIPPTVTDETAGPYFFPLRVMRMRSGEYRWRCSIDRAYGMRAYKITLGVCGGMCAALILGAAFLGMDALWVTVLSCAGVMAIAGGVCLFFMKLGGWTEHYDMNEDRICIGIGRTTRLFPYSKLRKVILGGDRIILEKKIGRDTVFIPEGDYDFVRNYVLHRIPGTTEVTSPGLEL